MKAEKPPAADRAAYYAEAASWSHDVNGVLRSSRNLAWLIALGLGAIALLEAVALVVMMPLKTVVPYTITVDRQTGYVETAQALKPGLLAQDAAVTQAFLAQYVMAREGYDVTDLQATYRKVALWSAGDARTRYLNAMSTSNPQSPMKLYGRTGILQATIKSISLLSKDSALVRFDVQHSDASGGPPARQPYAAVVGFRYTGAPMRMEDRFLNPLGFQVTSYRRDGEAGGAAPVTAVAP